MRHSLGGGVVIRGDWHSTGGTHIARSVTGHSLRPGMLSGRREASAWGCLADGPESRGGRPG